MKVLAINSVCGIGSTGRICTAVAELLESQGHECKIAYGRGEVPEKYEKYAIKIGSSFSVKIDALKTRLLDNAGFNSKKTTKQFVEWVKEYNPDVIHLHNLHGYYLNLEVLFAYLKSCGKPIVWTLHDCWTMTGHCSHFDYVACEKWKTGCFNCPQKSEYPKSLFKDNSKRNYEKKRKLFSGFENLTLIAPSKWLGKLVGQSFLKDYPVKVINNGIDLKVFKPTKGDFREKYNLENKFVLLGVAFGWGERKGLDVFIELAKRLDDAYQIVLVGTDEKTDKLLPKNIISIRRTQNQTELAEIYTAADLFVNPTREETLGLVNIEALACGTPVVTFKTGGSPETIDEKCGALVEKDDVDGLEREIRRIKNEKPFDEVDCIERAKKFNKEDKFLEYVELY